MAETAVPKSDDRLAIMRSRLQMAEAAFSNSRTSEVDDLKFLAGSPDNNWQWPAAVITSRTNGAGVVARPTLTINKLPQHVHQVTNDQRQNRASGKVIPANDSANADVAEIYEGIVRHIEYISDADVAINTACDNQVGFGEGYFRLLTKYCGDDSFDQDIYYGRIRNSFSVYMDPTMQDPCGADAKWCFITQDMLKTEYKTEFPDATPVTTLEVQGVGDESLSSWLEEETVRIAEYFYYETTKTKLNLWPGGETSLTGTPEDKQYAAQFGKPKKTRDVDQKQVKCIKTNGYEVLEEYDWAGKWIPVIRVIGNEFEVEGQIIISGLVRNAKDAQRMYNYWTSQEAEMLALAPKAPFIGYAGQFEGYEEDWKTANTVNHPYLQVNADPDGTGQTLPLPQRAPPPLPQAGLIQAKLGAADDIKGTTGQYDSSLGAASQETSGKAIIAREKQGDVGTFHYADNLSLAIRHATRQIVDLIPKIYDTQRIARIIGADGEVDKAKIDPTQPEAVKKTQNPQTGEIEKVYNLGVGEYDVMVTTGPNYMTKRQELLDVLTHILQSKPELWDVLGDLLFKEMDFEGARELSRRMRTVMDPKIFQDEDNPGVGAAKKKVAEVTQVLQQAVEHMKAMESQLEDKSTDQRIAMYDAETRRLAVEAKMQTPEEAQAVIMATIHEMMLAGELPVPPPGGHPAPEMPPTTPQPPPGAGGAPQGPSPSPMDPSGGMPAPDAPQPAPVMEPA